MSKIANKKHLASLDGALSGFSVFVVIRFSGISDFRAKALRADLRSANSKLIVLKNSIAKITFSSLNLDCQSNFFDAIKGPVALICSNDICSIAKKIHSQEIVGFNGKLEPLCCISNRDYVCNDDLEKISTLPSADVIRSGIIKMLLSRSTIIAKLAVSGSASLFKLFGYRANTKSN